MLQQINVGLRPPRFKDLKQQGLMQDLSFHYMIGLQKL